MKKMVPFLLAATLAVPTLALAQQGPDGGGATSETCLHRGGHGHGGGRGHGDPRAHAERRARMIVAILGLDAARAAQVQSILAESATEGEALRAAPRSDAVRERMRAIHDRATARIDAILTPAERTTMARVRAVHEEQRREHREHRGQRGQRGRGGETAPPARGGVDPRGI
jgi:hypothetical protein